MNDSDDRELRYADMTVLDLLTEMKDTSEVIVDLAYASVMFNSPNIADEVKKLEVEMDDLKYAIRYRVMLSCRTRDDAKQMAGILEVASAADRISDAAADITKLVQDHPEKRPYLNRVFNESDEKYRMLKISEKSDMCGRTLGEDLRVEAQTACRIIAVKNRHGWTFDPEGDFKLRAGDEIFARGSYESLDQLAGVTSGSTEYDFPEDPVSEESAEAEAEEDDRNEEALTQELLREDD